LQIIVYLDVMWLLLKMYRSQESTYQERFETHGRASLQLPSIQIKPVTISIFPSTKKDCRRLLRSLLLPQTLSSDCCQNHSVTAETRNKKQETRNQKPETRNKKPETRNKKPETRNQKPETRNQRPPPFSPSPLLP
jgi:hypothetical protein